ncbi:MAG: serine/threonine-protein kinase, partial [Planctomycetota bacterium]
MEEPAQSTDEEETVEDGSSQKRAPECNRAITGTDDEATENADATIEASFAVLEQCMQRLIAIAPVADPAELVELVPEISENSRRLVLVELMKYDLASAAELGTQRTLEFYWPAAGQILPHENIPFDLVLEEVQLRRAAGEDPKWVDYRQRFPDLADTIGRWLADGGAGSESTRPNSLSSGVPELPVGERFDDFQILKQLGQGAFARVYLARQISMHRLVALKATSRGSDEPKALSQLDHANVVRVYDQREVPKPPTILLYMQYLAGGTLADCIKHVRSLPPSLWSGAKLIESIDRCLVDANQTLPEQSTIRAQVGEMEWAEVVAWIGIQLAQGLEYASKKGVLHRDVKPANILLSAEAMPKLADFNVSTSGVDGRAGAAAYFGGSLAYMSPEQLQVADPTDNKEAEDLDGRSDLYALGIVLWELWQGKRPWTLKDLAANWTEAVRMQKDLRRRELEFQRPAETAAERVLEKAIRNLLEVAPEDRPSSGSEAAARLRLAFYPELATRFEPSKKSLSGRLLSVPTLLLAAILVFGPNVIASRFNYLYNFHRMGDKAAAMIAAGDMVDEPDEKDNEESSDVTAASGESGNRQEETSSFGTAWEFVVWVFSDDRGTHPVEKHFRWTSLYVNVIVYILGLSLFLLVVWPFVKIVHRGKEGRACLDSEIDYLWSIGFRATLIAFVLWVVSGVVFAASMQLKFPQSFSAMEALHFFLSLLLCGGVAWIYPFFGMTLVSLLVYYPKVIAPTMSDAKFDTRARSIRRFSVWYLRSAAAIPLIAVAALVMGELHANWILTGVAMTAVGLGLASFAHQKIDQTVE